jgi:hypothetical protein
MVGTLRFAHPTVVVPREGGGIQYAASRFYH